ncbi:hypothetical protein [Aquabacterium olei]|uniref:hypothetical protein n=1 Tax=Aquabacterium olei TaxID=1296669 RepID=UPI00131F2B91|nr:hypothetical protein [Aquabacterium olei]
MAIKLIVTQEFGDYPRGCEITEPEAIAAVLDGDNATNVVKVNAPDPEPAE